jgi:hypothetical protein
VGGLIIKILLSAFGITLTGALGFWLGIFRERIKGIEGKIIEEKLQLITELEHLVLIAPFEQPLALFCRAIEKVLEPYQRLKMLASGRKKKRLIGTWTAFEKLPELEKDFQKEFDLKNPPDKAEHERIQNLTSVVRLLPGT